MPPDPITKVDPPVKEPVAPPANDGVDPPAKQAKPEGFGESLASYWNDDKGADYGKLTEDMATLTAFKAERDSLAAQVPDNLDDYEVALPADFKLPDGMAFEVKADDPILPEARALAKELGLTKDQFKGFVALEAKRQIAEGKRLSELAAAEKTKLGSKGDDRIKAVTTWAEATIGKDKAGVLMPMMFTAKQIEAFEAIMKVAKGTGVQLNGGGRETQQPNGISEDDWAKMSPTQRIEYGRSHPVQKAS